MSGVSSGQDRRFIVFGLRIVADFGIALAAPAVLFALGGQWLDRRYGAAPWFTVLAFVIAAAVSAVYINRKARAYGREYQELINESLDNRENLSDQHRAEKQNNSETR